jgi:hypothetical protein
VPAPVATPRSGTRSALALSTSGKVFGAPETSSIQLRFLIATAIGNGLDEGDPVVVFPPPSIVEGEQVTALP